MVTLISILFYNNVIKTKVIFDENLANVKFEETWRGIKEAYNINSEAIYFNDVLNLSITEDQQILRLLIEFGSYEHGIFLVRQIQVYPNEKCIISKPVDQNIPVRGITVDEILSYFDQIDLVKILERVDSNNERCDIDFLHILPKGFLVEHDTKPLTTLIYDEGIFLKELSAQDSFQLPSNALEFHLYSLAKNNSYSYPQARLIILFKC